MLSNGTQESHCHPQGLCLLGAEAPVLRLTVLEQERSWGQGAAGAFLFLGPCLLPEFQTSLGSLGLENLVNWPNPQQILLPSQAELG